MNRIRKLTEKERLQRGEYYYFKRLITEVYPSGPVAIVSDTWNLWKVLGDILPRLKSEIMGREGKLVIRPDSSPTTPEDIICGNGYWNDGKANNLSVIYHSYPEEWQNELARKGLIECLWDIFGGTISSTGYKVLDPHIGAIYGDAITMERANTICQRLRAKGFASTNIVFGIGSYTYQHNTRDTLGFAMKATYCEVNGEPRDIFKDPITDKGEKKSAKGKLAVEYKFGRYILSEGKDAEKEAGSDILRTVFKDGVLVEKHTLKEIKENLWGS